MLRAVLRGIAAVGVCAALLVGSLMTWAGSGASAQEPAHVLYGTITVVAGSTPPTRLRALTGDTVCGSGAIVRDNERLTYALSIVSGDTKSGCARAGDLVRIVPVYDGVESEVGVFVTQEPGTVRALDLRLVNGTVEALLPASTDAATVLWHGPRAQASVVVEFVRAANNGRRSVEEGERDTERWIEPGQTITVRGLER